MARSMFVKGVESPDRLLDETSLFLRRVMTALPHHTQRMLDQLNSSDEDQIGRTVLLVDDDPRNVFASVLERRRMRVLTANNGSEAIKCIESDGEVASALADFMMAEMDGHQTIQRSESGPFRRLPIIALTAKTMKGNREKCPEAGASDWSIPSGCRLC
jgi:CheY-like chemotaxis protein